MGIEDCTLDRRRFLSVCGKAAAGLGVLALTGPLAACGSDTGQASPAASSASSPASASPSAGSAYYVERKQELTAAMEGYAHGMEAAMKSEYGTTAAAKIADDSVPQFTEILPELPYIGGDDRMAMTRLLISCSMSMAYCLAMLENGRTVDDAGRLAYFAYAAHAKMDPVPESKRYHPTDIPAERAEARAWATWSQQQPYADNWVAGYVGGLRRPYTYGFDYTACACVPLCKHLGIPQFARYLCIQDQVQYESSGQGMTRTRTIADGSDCCNFRFRSDGVVRLKEPFSAAKLREWGVVNA